MTRSKRLWEIEGYDSATVIFSDQIPQGVLSKTGVIKLLQRLAARHLTPDETIAATLRRNARRYRPLLEPHIDAGAKAYVVSVGENPHYTARVRHDPSGIPHA